jgi:hypothetical protein
MTADTRSSTLGGSVAVGAVPPVGSWAKASAGVATTASPTVASTIAAADVNDSVFRHDRATAVRGIHFLSSAYGVS